MIDQAELKWIFERQLHWISTADAKLAVLATIPLAMLGISLFDVAERVNEPDWQDLPLAMSTILLCVCLYFCKAALTPRLSGPKQSVIYFGAISKLSIDDFRRSVTGLSSDDFQNDLVSQIHRNSEIANVKHTNINKAIYWLAFSLPIWLLSIAIV